MFSIRDVVAVTILVVDVLVPLERATEMESHDVTVNELRSAIDFACQISVRHVPPCVLKAARSSASQAESFLFWVWSVSV